MSSENKLNRIGNEYSITSKLVDYIGNPDWKHGYNELLTTGDDSVGYGVLWNTVSAGCEDVASKIYKKVLNYTSNISDIDTCEVHSLKSFTQMLDYYGNTSYLDYEYPTGLAELVDVFSIKKNYLLKSGRILDLNSRKEMFLNTKRSFYSTEVMDGYNTDNVPTEIRVDGAGSLGTLGYYNKDEDINGYNHWSKDGYDIYNDKNAWVISNSDDLNLYESNTLIIPQEVSSQTISGTFQPWGLGVADGVVFVGTIEGNVHTYTYNTSGEFSFSDMAPITPDAFGSVVLGNILPIQVGDGGYLYVSNLNNGIDVFSFDVSGSLTHLNTNTGQDYWGYVITHGNKLIIISQGEISTSLIYISGVISLIDRVDTLTSSTVEPVSLDEFVYVITGTTIITYQISELGYITQIDSWSGSVGELYGMTTDGTYLYAFTRTNNILYMLKPNTSGQLTLISSASTSPSFTGFYDIFNKGSYVYLTQSKSLTIFSVNNNTLKKIYETSLNSSIVNYDSGDEFIFTLEKTRGIVSNTLPVNNAGLYPPQTGWSVVSGDSPTPRLSYIDQFTTDQLDYISSVSINPVDYQLITDDEKYIDYIEDCFYNLLVDNIYTVYREYEVSKTNPDSESTRHIYDPSNENTSTKSGYVWKNIISDLRENRLFRDDNSDDQDIRSAKLQYGIDSWFPEKKYVDQINAGIRKMSDFSTTEQIVLELELTRRAKERDKKLGVSKYYVERENRVKDYIRFIDLFNKSTETDDADEYGVDTSKFEITGSDSFILTDSTGNITLINDDAIRTTAKKLRNLVLKISYLRDNLKYQAQKYYINGTESILKDLIKDYFERYVYNAEDYWRYDVSVETGKIPKISKLDDFDIDIIEYIDPTEYLNVSASVDPTSADVNPRYWETYKDEYDVAFTGSELEDFYKNDLGLNFDIATSGDVSTYSHHLSSFLDVVFNSGATSATSSNIYTTTTVTSTVDTGIYYFDQSEVTQSGSVEKYPLSDDLFISGYCDYNTSNGNPNEGWIKYLSTNVIQIEPDSLETGQTLRCSPANVTPPNDDVGYFPLSGGVLNNNLVDNADYILEVKSYQSTLRDNYLNAFIFFDGVNEHKFGNSMANEYQTHYVKFTSYNNTSTPYLRLDNVYSADSIYIKYIELYKLGTPSDGSKKWFIPSDSLTLSSYTTSASVVTTVENSGAYNKYIGTSDGYTPYANIKNQIHPSYMAHPFMKAFIEYIRDENPIENIFNYETLGYDVDYEAVSSRIDTYGNLVNYWWNENIDFSGYRTNYERSLNIDDGSLRNKLIDYDSPFYYKALVDLFEQKSTFITNLLSDTNEYYTHLNLSDSEARRIRDQLNYVTNFGSFTEDCPLNRISSKSIYKYLTDQYGNVYTLYKNEDSFDELGELWVKLKDHPISFPAFVLDELEENGRNQTLSQLPIGVHNSIVDLLEKNDEFGGDGTVDIYDMGYDSNWIYFVFKEPDELTASSVFSNVMFGNITTGTSEDGEYTVYGFTKDEIHNLETLPFSLNQKYIGTYIKNNTFTSIFSKVDSNGLMQEDDRSIGYTQYVCELYIKNFNPVVGVGELMIDVPVKYQTKNDKTHNEWTLTNDGELVSVVFESVKLPILTNQDHSVIDYINSNETSGFVKYQDLINFDNRPVIYDNGFTTIDITVGENDYPTTNSDSTVSYFYKNSDIGYLSLYPSNTYVNKLWDSSVLAGEDEFKLQFFGEPIGVDSTFSYEGTQSNLSGFSVEYPYTSLSEYQAFAGISEVPELSGLTSYLFHTLEGDLEHYPELSLLTVSGAGTESANGEYFISDNLHQGKVAYILGDGLHEIKWNPLQDAWVFSKGSSGLYAVEVDTELPPTTGWFNIGGGAVPTFTYGYTNRFTESNIGIFELVNGDPLSCYYEITGDEVASMYFKSGTDFKFINNDNDSVTLSSSLSGFDNYTITLDNKNEAKFTIS